MNADPFAVAAGALVSVIVGFFGGRSAGHGQGLATGRREALEVLMTGDIDGRKRDAPPTAARWGHAARAQQNRTE